MTTPSFLFHNVIDPLLPLLSLTADINIPASDNAAVLLLATAGQESSWKYRLQQGGPARSYLQMEGGAASGLAGLFKLFPSKVSAICSGFDVPCNLTTVFEAIAWHDPVAFSMGRLLYWSNPAPLPAVGDAAGSWQYYLDTWRPGAPRPDAWPAVYATSLSIIKGG